MCDAQSMMLETTQRFTLHRVSVQTNRNHNRKKNPIRTYHACTATHPLTCSSLHLPGFPTFPPVSRSQRLTPHSPKAPQMRTSNFIIVHIYIHQTRYGNYDRIPLTAAGCFTALPLHSYPQPFLRFFPFPWSRLHSHCCARPFLGPLYAFLTQGTTLVTYLCGHRH
jgi:hypothetical protein